VDFVGPVSDYNNGTDRKVVRGGSYDDDIDKMRSSYRSHIVRSGITPIVGYRLVMQSVYPY
jgi:formylglycine-generating enzyme required for sulfatase activity